MKIAVTTQGQDMSAQIDPRFGRAAGFLIVDADSGDFHYVDNSQNLNAMQGAGIQAAENVLKEGVEVVITGHCGPKAFQVLSTAKVAILVGAESTVAEAIEAFKNGTLKSASEADVGGHWM